MTPSAYAGRITNLGVHNLSSAPISWNLRCLLGKGTKFIPYVKPRSPALIFKDVCDFLRRLEWRLFYQNQGEQGTVIKPPQKFIIPSQNWLTRDQVPPSVKFKCRSIHRLANETLQNFVRSGNLHKKDNLTKQERKTLTEFRKCYDRIALNADKNLGLVIVDRSEYMEACRRHLEATNCYTKLSVPPAPQRSFECVLDAIRNMVSFQSFPTYIKKYIERYHANTDLPTFYMLPKIHKPVLGWRPIIPATGTWNASFAKIVDEYLQPLVRATPSYLQDSKSLIRTLEMEVHPAQIQPHETLFFVTADVESLYTNIPLDEAWVTTREAIRSTALPFKNCLSMMCQHVLYNNAFQHDGHVYLQVDGVATGSPLAPSVANIFMHSLEKDVVSKWGNCILLYRRYIDDLLILFKGDEQNLHAFIAEMNDLHRNIKLNWNVRRNMVEFLDLVIYKGPRWPHHLDYRTHQKALNSYLYLPWSSFHPTPSKLSFIAAELLRYARNCSQRSDYIQVKKLFGNRLKQRGYPVQVINRVFSTIHYSARFSQLFEPNPHRGNVSSVAPLVFKTRYDDITRSIHWGKILNPKPLFDEPPRIITAYRRHRNLFEIFHHDAMTTAQAPDV